MTRRTNNRLMIFGACCGLALVPISFWFDHDRGMISYALVVFCLFSFFFCFWVFGVMARFASFMGRALIDAVGKPGFKTALDHRRAGTLLIFKDLGIWVEDPPAEKAAEEQK